MAELATKPYSGSILDAFLPKQSTKTSGKETVTHKTDLSPDAINEIIRQMMEGDTGLANIMTQQSGKGLYDSTTSQLLANDLAARVAGKAALASAPTTVTKKTSGKAPGTSIDPKAALAMKLVGELAGKFFGPQQTGGGQAQQGGMFDPVMAAIKKQLGFGGDETSNFGGFGFGGGFDLGNLGLGLGTNFADFGGGFNNFAGGGFGNFGSFGGGIDTFLSQGLGGGGFGSDPFSLTGGGNFGLGNTYGGYSDFSNFLSPTSYGGGYNDYGSSAFDFGPVNYALY